MSNLKIQVILDLVEKVTAPLKRVMNESGKAGQSLKKLRDQLKQLEDKQKTIASFRQLHQELHHTGERLSVAQNKVKTLANEIAATENPTRTLTREFERAKRAAQLISEQNQRQGIELQRLRDRLSSAGISTRNLVSNERELRNSMAQTNREISTQQHKLAELARRQEKVAAARSRMENGRAFAAQVGANGMGMMMTGTAMAAPVWHGLNEAKHYETEMQRIRALGLGDKVSQDAIKFAQGMQTYGTSALENLELMRDSLTIFADGHHAEMVMPTLAKMKFANAAMFGEEQGAEKGQTFMNMLKVIELRGGMASKEKFEHEANLVQKVLTATGGRVGPNEWLNFIKTGGVAAKALQDEAFFQKMEPLIQEMGGHRVGTGLMSAYANVYQGKTTVRAARQMQEYGLLDKSKVVYNKIGMLKEVKEGALVGGEMFKSDPMAWLETVLLPKLAAKGINDPERIKDAIANIFTNRTASNLMTQMYLQRDQIHKNAKLNAGADGINELNDKGKNTAKGKELEAMAKIKNSLKAMGETVLPIYASALETVASVLESVNKFMKENPGLTKAVIVGLASLAATKLALGALSLVVSALFNPFAILRYGFTMLGMRAASTSARLGLFRRMINGLKTAFQSKGKVLQWLGAVWSRLSGWVVRAFTWLRGLGAYLPRLLGLIRTVGMAIRLAFVANPVGLVITAVLGLAFAAHWLYKNWAPARTFFDGIWRDLKSAFNGGLKGVIKLIINVSPFGVLYRLIAKGLSYLGVQLPARFSDFGKMLFNGLINGIKSMGGAVKDAIFGMGEKVTSWFKEKLGINSPSRVFTGFGTNISEGLSNGIQAAQNLPLNQVNHLSKRLSKAGAGLALTASLNPAFAGMPDAQFGPATNLARFDERPPLTQANKAAAPRQGDTIQITINAAPGTDAQAIAKAVAEELDKRERQKDRAKRSALHDYDAY